MSLSLCRVPPVRVFAARAITEDRHGTGKCKLFCELVMLHPRQCLIGAECLLGQAFRLRTLIHRTSILIRRHALQILSPSGSQSPAARNIPPAPERRGASPSSALLKCIMKSKVNIDEQLARFETRPVQCGHPARVSCRPAAGLGTVRSVFSLGCETK